MARIRSIHPSLCTDEIYMGLSLPAKAAWPLMWMECDDHGAFEWKPVVLKARLFPADPIDMAAILAELEAAGAIKQVEIDGKPVGLIRNFCKYQRPKKPVYRVEITEEMRTFVGVKPPKAEPVPNQSPTDTEVSPQRKEEGGSGNKKEIGSVASATRPANDDFENFKKEYPRRGASNPWQPALKLFLAAVKRGSDPKEIIKAAAAYRAECDKLHTTATDKVAQAQTWLRQERWRDYLEGAEADAARVAKAEAELKAKGWEKIDNRWQKVGESAA